MVLLVLSVTLYTFLGWQAAQRAMAAKPTELSSTPGSYMIEGQN